ncbi:tryptophan--tRNA ligase [Rossellomorea vietnamensis]|uniref:Tryptophan--tRNA ligase n=1 Tax=Rossellomorea vietnamensis TaxID=218284 RepID=A0A5D4KKR7_9BACI|nr:tryptophan--tRNA ligase [Rossellomorea vietnamensis]TYR77439.1 tryptophan--tRNA ligase [Rossellomorea vietnamensis]
MERPTALTGIKPTGHPHLGNYIGAIKPALEMAKDNTSQGIYFIADYHALNSVQDRKKFKEYTYEIAAAWLSLGLDPEKVIFYRQSDVPEILELHWILSCMTPKGLMNRAHAYKAKVEENMAEANDSDAGVNMGLFTYPILMAADILLFNSDKVPVGKDQVQHVEIARDIAENFNRTFGEAVKLPQYVIEEETAVIPGLDGRKMSKSYGNTIPLFAEEKALKKLVNKIVTDSTPPEEPKEVKGSSLFTLYKEFAAAAEADSMKEKYKQGIGWGQVKKEVFEVMNRELSEPRQKYYEYLDNKQEIDKILERGAERARSIASVQLKKIKEMIGC